MLYGEADPLNSSYHISYNMLLNMLRVEDADPDFLVKSSFHQYQQEASAPALEASGMRTWIGRDLVMESKYLSSNTNSPMVASCISIIRSREPPP